jgi:hypothetical protein
MEISRLAWSVHLTLSQKNQKEIKGREGRKEGRRERRKEGRKGENKRERMEGKERERWGGERGVKKD